VAARTTSPGAGRPVRGVGPLDRAAILSLQRSAGNAAVNRLLQRCAPGGCSCGGVCGESDGLQDPSELDSEPRGHRTEEGSRLLANELRHVVQRSPRGAVGSHASAGGERRSSSTTSQLQRQSDEGRSPREVCGAGEIGGQVYMCCHPNPYFYVAECSELRTRTFDECWENSRKDQQAADNCNGKATFASCHCLDRHRPGFCTCGGLV
jgi:hypothetical protein